MISLAHIEHSTQIASIHKHTISQGFLSRLGIGFLDHLYKFLIINELVFVDIENGKVLGFVSCAIKSDGIMKRFLIAQPISIFKILFILIKEPSLIFPLIETYRTPSLSMSDSGKNIRFPETELLSISVNPNYQNSGIGIKLLNSLEMELKRKEIYRYKVIAGEKLLSANKYYLKNGFELAKKITIHGNDVSNVYIKII